MLRWFARLPPTGDQILHVDRSCLADLRVDWDGRISREAKEADHVTRRVLALAKGFFRALPGLLICTERALQPRAHALQ